MISFIIVHYHVKKQLFACLQSIYASKTKQAYEIIVVDNDEEKEIYKELKKKFPKVIYVPNENRGFGQGNNVGSQLAKGEYLFFLNPDTIVLPDSVNKLISILYKHKDIGIVAPLLLNTNGEIVHLQGARDLTPKSAIFSFSFIKKILPNNKIFRKYWYLDEWNKKTIKKVGSVPGAAFVIRHEIFKKIKGFDEKFFLYFEEHDLCKRVKTLGWKIVIEPNAKVTHSLGNSTKKSKRNIDKIFRQSRFYYFRKHFGIFNGLVTEFFLRTGKYAFLLSGIVVLGAYLRIIDIGNTMIFIGDQGWFYLSARDVLLKGEIPLVGIASSHPWLHQGALWTYLLAGSLWLFHFNPLHGAYLSAFLDVVTIFVIYKIGRLFFSQRTGVIAAALYAASPLAIFYARLPYHTSPIPLFTALALFALLKWINGQKYYFPLLIMFLAILYNFELATALLTLFVISVLSIGILKKEQWAKAIFNKKILFLTSFGFFLPMFPMILYDISHGFPQTLKFLVWVGYKLLVLFGYPPLQPTTATSFTGMISFLAESYKRLLFPHNGYFAFAFFVVSVLVLGLQLIKKRNKNILIVCFLNLFLVSGFLGIKTSSEAYLPVLFPSFFLAIALVFDYILNKKIYVIPTLATLGVIIFLNIHFLITHKYTFSQDRDSFYKRLSVAKYLVKEAGEKEYNLRGEGPGSQFQTFTMNYQYLTWWLGHEPSQKKQSLEFVISEKEDTTIVRKVIK